MLTIKGKKAIKSYSEEGDNTPTGTEMYIIAECVIPDAVNDMAKADGITPLDVLYAAAIPGLDKINLVGGNKLEILDEELSDIEIEFTQEEYDTAKVQLTPLRFEFYL